MPWLTSRYGVAGVIVNRTQQEIPNEATMKDTEDKSSISRSGSSKKIVSGKIPDKEPHFLEGAVYFLPTIFSSKSGGFGD